MRVYDQFVRIKKNRKALQFFASRSSALPGQRGGLSANMQANRFDRMRNEAKMAYTQLGACKRTVDDCRSMVYTLGGLK